MTDLRRLRDDFPIFSRTVNDRPLAFLDSAASSQKPTQVIEAMTGLYRSRYANVHRGAYTLSQESTEAYEEARRKVARFLNASDEREVILTRNTAAGLNHIAYGWGLNRLREGDRILTSVMEHHSNIVPWQIIARHTGAELAYADISEDFRVEPERVAANLDE